MTLKQVIEALVFASPKPITTKEIVAALRTAGVALKFTELFAGAASRTEIVVTFLALLELIRLKQVRCEQAEPFSEIELRAA